jgi:surfactin synthase thioesterase subunit
MASTALLPVIGVAGIGLARAVTATIGEGLSFAAELARGAKPDVQPDQAQQQREQLQQRIEALAARIKQQLGAAGIDVSQPLTLTDDGLGGIAALEHPQRAAIEELLEGDFLLLRDFDRLQDDYEAAAANDSSLQDKLQLVVTEPAGSSHG